MVDEGKSKQALSSDGSAAACARSLARDDSFELPGHVLDPNAGSQLERSSKTALRGRRDALALEAAHHDALLFKQEAPAESLARRFYSVLEQERYESLGANRYPGVLQNLDARDQQPIADASAETAEANLLLSAACVLSRQRFRDNTTAAAESETLCRDIEVYRERLDKDPLIGQLLSHLASITDDQPLFSSVAARLARYFSLCARTPGFREGAEVDAELANECACLDSDASEISAVKDEPNDPDVEEVVEELADIDTSEGMRTDDNAPAENGEPLASESTAESAAALHEQLKDEAPADGPDPIILHGRGSQTYRAYTLEFDETVAVSDWADLKALDSWRIELDRHMQVHGRLVRRLAARLQRVLLARQHRQWQFDLDEGQLDSSRLTRIISDPLSPLVFKAETETALRDTTITLLIDNSRSMLGRPILMAAACADILARTLERCGVSVEILGFTTVHLHGGRSAEQWQKAGEPENPGRLNDLRHIIYKSANTPYRSARRHLGLMLDRDILKQNIDGEALQWAYRRLLQRPEERRILLCLSDGAPVDTSTLGANSGDYLACHLQQVIDGIERDAAVELLAIGIGHDVGRYYRQAVSVFDSRQLGAVMLDQLESLFSQAA